MKKADLELLLEIVTEAGVHWEPERIDLAKRIIQAELDRPESEPMTGDEIIAIAYRNATTYAHRSDPTQHSYAFVKHTLLDFVRAIQEGK